MDEFEANLAKAFQAPMDRPPGADVAAWVEARLALHRRLRVAAVTAGTLAGISVCAGLLDIAHALDALPGLLRGAGAVLPRLASEPVLLLALGGALLAVAMARVAARDL